MKFFVSEKNLSVLNQCLDLSLKSEGLAIIGPVVQAISVFNSQNGGKEGTYDLGEDTLNILSKVFDVALKAAGLNGLQGVVELLNLFNTPIQEAESAPVADAAKAADKEDVAQAVSSRRRSNK